MDMAGLTDQLASPELSVASDNYTVTRCMPDGERVEAVPPILESDPNRRPSYWIPRQGLLGLLTRALPPSVRKLYGSELVDISRTADGGVEVVAREANGREFQAGVALRTHSLGSEVVACVRTPSSTV